MWYVYAIENEEKNFVYVGYTHNIKRRFAKHSGGKVQSTKAYLPLKRFGQE